MRPVYCGNIDYGTRQRDLDRLFSKYGRVERVEMKNGFAFIYYDDERDAEDAIRRLDNTRFGYNRRRLSVEWGRHLSLPTRTRSTESQRPTKTLFVVNFDPIHTRTRDIERHFELYGKVLQVQIRRNFAFVHFETQEDATKAFEYAHKSKILDRMVSVQYAARDDGERVDRHGSPRRRGRYGRYGDSPYGHSVSPVHHSGQPSPDYGPYNGPAYDRNQSPNYGRFPKQLVACPEVKDVKISWQIEGRGVSGFERVNSADGGH